ncbi:MAG TPA: DUF3108 domain-containing protein [Aquabacterium sp.]|uniref:DUF3108 domain-containing protein n=1 Tax=Aquabacterium sp. TaxID=1872578 RepID=UPI002E339502|nr:DUF3108 domain-containing protein [Aquabacterium sp.]HEX5356784.1 DUF3108 domain-containing protein [Aquabacterium sp.]
MAASLKLPQATPPGMPDGHAARPQRRWIVILALTLLVALAHLLVTYEVSQQMADLSSSAGSSIKRMEATYVTEIKQTAPPVAAAAPPAPPAAPQAPAVKKREPKVAKAASAPDDAASAAKVADGASAAAPGASTPPDTVAKVAEPEPAASTPDADKPVAANEPAPTASGPTFIWPKATKVSYKMEVYYRGPIEGGRATVEWVRQNQRYQVRLDASVPLLGWISMISEGKVGANGLSPERYESVNQFLFKSSKPATLKFEEQEVVLASGERIARVPDLQDPVSHLIHLAYRFITHPNLLQQGNTIEMPLASSKRMDVIAYDVINEEVLHTGMGDVRTMHVKPRRLTQDKNALLGDIWFAPSLQYLPVRIYAKWADDIYVDMQMDGAPQQTPGDPPEY